MRIGGACGGAGQPALAAWSIDPQVGGSFKLDKEDEAPFLTLTGNRMLRPDGEQDHAGRLMQTARVIAVPGRKYTLTVTARGEGGITIGAVEFADRYSPMVSRLLHLMIVDILATCVALRIGGNRLQPMLKEMKNNLRNKRYA